MLCFRRVSGLADDYLTAFALKFGFQLLVALVAGLDDLVVVTAQNGFHADGEPNGCVEGTGRFLIVEVVAVCL